MKKKHEKPARSTEKTMEKKKYEEPAMAPLDDDKLDKVCGGAAGEPCGSGGGALNMCQYGTNIVNGTPCGSGGSASGSCQYGSTAGA